MLLDPRQPRRLGHLVDAGCVGRPALGGGEEVHCGIEPRGFGARDLRRSATGMALLVEIFFVGRRFAAVFFNAGFFGARPFRFAMGTLCEVGYYFERTTGKPRTAGVVRIPFTIVNPTKPRTAKRPASMK